MAKIEIEMNDGQRKRVTLKEAHILVTLKKARYLPEPEEKALEPAHVVETPRPRRTYRRRNMAGATEQKDAE